MKTKISLLAAMCAFIVAPAKAQVGNCDSLQITATTLNPFNTNEILVRTTYSDFDNFISYPGFLFVDDEGFILANETVNYFGMSTEQVHVLEIEDLDVQQNIPNVGHLELWSFFFEELECVESGEFVFWQQQDCVPLSLTFSALGIEPATALLNYEISNMSNGFSEEGEFLFDNPGAPISLSFCLPEGCGYTLSISSELSSGTGLSYSFHFQNYLAVGAEGFISDSLFQINHEFDVYNCMVTNTGIQKAADWSVYPNPATNWIEIRQDIPKDFTYEVFNISGQQISAGWHFQNTATCRIDCVSWPVGVYFIRTKVPDSVPQTFRVVIAQ